MCTQSRSGVKLLLRWSGSTILCGLPKIAGEVRLSSNPRKESSFRMGKAQIKYCKVGRHTLIGHMSVARLYICELLKNHL